MSGIVSQRIHVSPGPKISVYNNNNNNNKNNKSKGECNMGIGIEKSALKGNNIAKGSENVLDMLKNKANNQKGGLTLGGNPTTKIGTGLTLSVGAEKSNFGGLNLSGKKENKIDLFSNEQNELIKISPEDLVDVSAIAKNDKKIVNQLSMAYNKLDSTKKEHGDKLINAVDKFSKISMALIERLTELGLDQETVALLNAMDEVVDIVTIQTSCVNDGIKTVGDIVYKSIESLVNQSPIRANLVGDMNLLAKCTIDPSTGKLNVDAANDKLNRRELILSSSNNKNEKISINIRGNKNGGINLLGGNSNISSTPTINSRLNITDGVIKTSGIKSNLITNNRDINVGDSLISKIDGLTVGGKSNNGIGSGININRTSGLNVNGGTNIIKTGGLGKNLSAMSNGYMN